MIVKRVINNIREYRKKGKEQENKKMNQVFKRSKNKESADHNSHDNSDTNIGQDNGSSNEVNSRAKNSSSNEEDKFIELLKNKSDNTGEESTNPNEIEMEQKTLPITHAKHKQIENEVNEVVNIKKKFKNRIDLKRIVACKVGFVIQQFYNI
ncbi:hypothetical protein RCL_jg11487.t1 [Rhizophagus clarus]|uniref:Uncharacterized protein n=1 Tax=Rhizophagus clarus TaxID=94130 RepID=A0A8H3LBJ2_9GLOM|nr:hypothetical protein RCL_jg11487.t1 [Rhizophagus clarus]